MKWTIVNSNDIYIRCEGVYEDYYQAVGALYCMFLDCIQQWLDDSSGWQLVSKTEFYPLESDSGFGWTAYLKRGDDDTMTEHWFLLEVNEHERTGIKKV